MAGQPAPLEAQMSVMVLFGAGALIGLVALTLVVLVTLLTEAVEPETIEPDRTAERDRSVL